ncbi:MAG: histidine--tRNA ligase [Chitinophagaceae bacterium]
MTKPSLPQGTRDFGPETVRKRNYIFNVIREVFELYGFQPLETPALENLETLTGKYGEEGDKLIFKILNNGLQDPKNTAKARAAFENILEGRKDKNITERALKYDLTIPFARYVAMNYGQLIMPFKRYQVQPVWRADRPQKGRYREFYQCDADVVGSNSLLNEIELAIIYSQAFSRLKMPVAIKINSRKILSALAEKCGGVNKLIDITVAIDKLDKIGLEKVKEELSARGLGSTQVTVIEDYLLIGGDTPEKITKISSLLGDVPSGRQGIFEIEYVLSRLPLEVRSQVSADFTLARGLDYYTGIIFEVKALDAQMGSIGGGGRYDDLTGLFGVPGVPGVGISFGVDRIYDVMEELNLFPGDVHVGTQLLFLNLGEAESNYAFGIMQQLRGNGTRCEIYPDHAKFEKQFKYADRKNIPFAIMIGSREMENNTCSLKEMKTGEQRTIGMQELLSRRW